MRINENIAIATPKVLLVPYDAHHVRRYNEWMQDEALREATASDLLTLDEEYENQQSWRRARDKLTFIVCLPAREEVEEGGSGVPGDSDADATGGGRVVRAGEDDAPARMVGDVNLFLTPLDDEDDDVNDGDGNGVGVGDRSTGEKHAGESAAWLKGEIDIMIASPEHRRKGLGEAAVRAFLRFLTARHEDIVGEYAGAESARVKKLVAKINAGNKGSIRLFGNLGFRKEGEPDYFNEVTMVMDFPPPTLAAGKDGGGYRECFYDRAGLK